jgi:hypothetical protein
MARQCTTLYSGLGFAALRIDRIGSAAIADLDLQDYVPDQLELGRTG